LARELVSALLDRLGASGVTDGSLTVHPDNRVAKDLYLRFGFEMRGTEPDYFGSSEPRLLLGRSLP
ncbi:MAG: GNAT family N-acetyltransferase, partial [Thermoanaerobaculia bacterium]